MKNASTFRDLDPARAKVPVRIDGQEYQLADGENLAAAMLAAGIVTFRHSPQSGAPRGPFCMMGACFDCQVEIGGVIRQACMQQVAAGMDILSTPSDKADM